MHKKLLIKVCLFLLMVLSIGCTPRSSFIHGKVVKVEYSSNLTVIHFSDGRIVANHGVINQIVLNTCYEFKIIEGYGKYWDYYDKVRCDD